MFPRRSLISAISRSRGSTRANSASPTSPSPGGRLLQSRFYGVLPPTLQRFGALVGQPGGSTPNCFAYSAFNRCQPPNFMASVPAMRPMG